VADEGHTLATAPYYRLLRTLSGEHVLGGERSRSTLGRASVGARRTGREALGGGGAGWAWAGHNQSGGRCDKLKLREGGGFGCKHANKKGSSP
jgi:hypothetical protein